MSTLVEGYRRVWHSTGMFTDRQRSPGVAKRAVIIDDLNAVDPAAVSYLSSGPHIYRWQLGISPAENMLAIESHRLSPGNIIHQVLLIQSEMVSLEKHALAYRSIADIIDEVKIRLDQKTESSPAEKLQLVSRVIVDKGFKRTEMQGELFVNQLFSNSFNCLFFGFIALAVAQELDWPVAMVDGHALHVLVRWDDGTTIVHFDQNGIYSGKQDEIAKGIASLNNSEVISLALTSRGSIKLHRGLYADALVDFDEALRFNPVNQNTYGHIGCAFLHLKQYTEALGCFKKLFDLFPLLGPFPWNAMMIAGRGEAKAGLGLYAEAIIDYDDAIRRCASREKLGAFDTEVFADVLCSRGDLKVKLGLPEEAKADFERALQIMSSNRQAKAGLRKIRPSTSPT
jgi:tetratricopeptide (TPR) repeat protein